MKQLSPKEIALELEKIMRDSSDLRVLERNIAEFLTELKQEAVNES